MNFSEWLSGNIVHIIIAAVGFGGLWMGQRDQGRQLDRISKKLDDQDERTREFWRSDWSDIKSTVSNHGVRIDTLEREASWKHGHQSQRPSSDT